MNDSLRFNPEMLTLARQAREFTQEELAGKSGISQTKVSKFENGLAAPVDDDLDRLARAVDVPKDFFFQEGYRYTPPVRYHRKRASVSQRLLDRIHAEINIRAQQLRELLKAATFEPELELRLLDPDMFDGEVEEIARAVRSAWRLPRGPIQNMVRLLERAGIVIIPMRFGLSEVDAIAQVIPGLPPMIFVNQESPMDRLRFTLAHELGHLVMHAFPSPDMEKEANRFAAEFLMPAADIATQLQRVSLQLLASLKTVWKVSMAAILETAKRLGAVTHSQYVRLRTELSRLGFLKREPASLDVPREVPELLDRLVKFHVEQLGYGLEELAKLFRDFPHRVRETYFATARTQLRLVG